MIIRLTALTSAFALGLGVVVLYYFSSLPKVAEPELLPAPEVFECKKSKAFPGLSRRISEIERGKSDYFPKDILGNDMSPKHSVAGWYGKHLKAMGEDSLLYISSRNVESYRFLWLRTFHHPIFVRVERIQHEPNANEFVLFSKELDGAGGYKPGKLFNETGRVLTEKQWCEFMNLLEKANYWKLPTAEKSLGGHDGAEWIMEGVKDNRYHIVERWSPDKGEYREGCIYLLKLSGVDTDRLKDDLY